MTEKMPSAAAATAHAAERRPDTHAVLVFVSPCRAEPKNQDRARVIRQGDTVIAAVCDGVTHSMHGGDAAEIVFSDPNLLWSPDGGLESLVERLRSVRSALIAEGKCEDPAGDSYLSRAFAQMRVEARQTSYQTTLVTARVAPTNGGSVLVESKTCGDSALFVFDALGRLLHSNRNLDEETWGFGHLSCATEVLPDHFRGELPVTRTVVPASAHVVLCTDGFYDAFDSPSSLFRWLLLHSANLAAGDDRDFTPLHEQLDQRTGDDDIALVWLCPQQAPLPLPAPQPQSRPKSHWWGGSRR